MFLRPGALTTAACAFTCVLAQGVDPAAGEPRRGGRVVRVPRPPKVLSTAVRICSFYEESVATCDRPVQVGEPGVVIDDDRNRGTATVRVVEAQTDGCGVPVQWRIAVEMQASDADEPAHGLLVLDYELEERAHTLSPAGPPPREGEQVWQVIDRDGDGDGDLRVSKFACDARGEVERGARASHSCTDYWLFIRRWQRARSDRQPVCDR